MLDFELVLEFVDYFLFFLGLKCVCGVVVIFGGS